MQTDMLDLTQENDAGQALEIAGSIRARTHLVHHGDLVIHGTVGKGATVEVIGGSLDIQGAVADDVTLIQRGFDPAFDGDPEGAQIDMVLKAAHMGDTTPRPLARLVMSLQDNPAMMDARDRRFREMTLAFMREITADMSMEAAGAITVDGAMGARVKIRSTGIIQLTGASGYRLDAECDGDFRLGGTLQAGSKVEAGGKAGAGDIDRGAELEAEGDIVCGHLGEKAEVESENGSVTCGDVGEEAEIEAERDIFCGHVGEEAMLEAGGNIICGNLDEEVILEAGGNVVCDAIGADCRIEAGGDLTCDTLPCDNRRRYLVVAGKVSERVTGGLLMLARRSRPLPA